MAIIIPQNPASTNPAKKPTIRRIRINPATSIFLIISFINQHCYIIKSLSSMSNYINKEQDRRLFNIDGHIKVINSEMGDVKKDIGTVKTDLATVKTDVCWLKRFFFIVATASIASLIGVLIGLLR